MKLSASLSLVVIALAASSMQSASAQENARGARFNYAPNTWKAESSRVPKGYGEFADPQHNVHQGSVPTSDMLGLDKDLLSKPVPAMPAPMPQPQVAARPTTTAVTPAWSVPKTNANFSPSFGKPQSLVAQSIPAAMPAPHPAIAKPAVLSPVKPASVASAPAAKQHHQASVHTNAGVHGHLLPPHIVAPIAATPAVASYGKNFGYVPGTLMPTVKGGSSAESKVTGKLMLLPPQQQHHHHQ